MEGEIYRKWEAKAAVRYCSMVHNHKKRRRQGRPPFVPEVVWVSWGAYWDTEVIHELFRKEKKNDFSQPDGEGTIKHRGVSKSAATHDVDLVIIIL